MLSYLDWDPSPALFSWNLPLLGRPLLWYGLFFALGVFISYRALIVLLKREKQKEAHKIADQISTYLIVGILLGARLFDMLFYESGTVFFRDPLFIFKIWEGGLSSHGGVLGLIVALFVYQKRHSSLSLFHLMDLLSIVAGPAAAFIRIGNFFNQEVLGTPTTVPWAVVMGHPLDGSFPVPRHPVQLYEAFFYLAAFALMWRIKDRYLHKLEGTLTGLFIVSLFSFRFVIEFFKEEQSVWMGHGVLTMGQWLSIPLICLGLFLVLRRKS